MANHRRRSHRRPAPVALALRFRRRSLALLSVSAAVLGLAVVPHLTATAVAGTKAFPGAEGFGSDTPGGRGGRVIEVTNLDDSGPGSLRAALTASGPRIVVFRVGGTVALSSTIKVKQPYLTVAGQTAPGDGILIRNAPGRSGDVATLRIQTNDVILRGVRIRSGAPSVMGTSGDSLTIESSSTTKARNIVVDHNSFSWATDETVSSYYDTQNITFSYNIVSEGLSHSTHQDGEHSKGLFGSGDLSYGITMHHNLMAHNVERNPEVSTAGLSDVRNNVVYDWGKWATSITDKRAGQTNVVNNWYKSGPSQTTTRPEVDFYSYGVGMQVYVAGNERADGSPASVSSGFAPYQQAAPLPTAPVTTTDAQQAYSDVMGGAGARVPALDPVDVRILGDVRNGTGSAIDDPSQVGGWPTMNGGAPPADNDHDGMPDSWETAHGLDPNVDDSAGDRNGDGYTNVEEYINGLIDTPTLSTSSSTTTTSVPATTTTSAPATTTTSAPATTTTSAPATTTTSAPASTTTSAPATTTSSPPAGAAQTLERRVASRTDDAEELVGGRHDGTTSTKSVDLELVKDGAAQQRVGVRFVDVEIPRGATIAAAWVEFTAKDPGSGADDLTIRAEDSDNAATYAATRTYNLTGRALAAASVGWAPGEWVAGSVYRTPDLASVVQEVVSRGGWTSGNALAFQVIGPSGTRNAYSYDGKVAGAPLLHVEYTV